MGKNDTILVIGLIVFLCWAYFSLKITAYARNVICIGMSVFAGVMFLVLWRNFPFNATMLGSVLCAGILAEKFPKIPRNTEARRETVSALQDLLFSVSLFMDCIYVYEISIGLSLLK